jgi:hypothetical protein
MPTEASAATTGGEALRFRDLPALRAWLERLPSDDSVARHAELLAQVGALARPPLAPAVKLALLEELREPVARTQSSYAEICKGRPVPLEEGDRAIWEGVVALWRAMAAGYEALIGELARGAGELGARAALLCQRALRCTGAAMFEHNRVYHAVPGELWQQLHRLYVFAENAGVAGESLADALGREVRETSCAATYVHALLGQLARPDALTVRQMEVADRWLERWESLVALRPDPVPRSGVPALAVDLASPRGVRFARELPSAGVRHLDLEPLDRELRQALAALREGRAPRALGLGELRRDSCANLLRKLHLQWCAAGTGRALERTATEARVTVAASIPAIHFHLTGRAFRPPVELTARERLELDRFGAISDGNELGIASQRSAAIEVWTILDKSASGMLGICREPRAGSRVSHNQLLGLKAAASKTIYIGVVQRLSVEADGTILAGLRIVSSAPQAAAARQAEAGGPETPKYDRALLLPGDAAHSVPETILVLPGWYGPGRLLEVHADGRHRILLQALLERGPNFERAAYSCA